MSSAIVKSGKFYEVQRRVDQRLRVARPIVGGQTVRANERLLIEVSDKHLPLLIRAESGL